MSQTSTPLAPLSPHELATCFRRLALLTNDTELSERMIRHADEAEQEVTTRKKSARH